MWDVRFICGQSFVEPTDLSPDSENVTRSGLSGNLQAMGGKLSKGIRADIIPKQWNLKI